METITTIAAFTALFLSAITAITGIYALILVKAMEKSTHAVTYMPIDPEFKKESEKQLKAFNADFKEDLEENFEDLISNAY